MCSVSYFQNIWQLDLNELVPEIWIELSKAMQTTKEWGEIIFFLIVKLTTVCRILENYYTIREIVDRLEINNSVIVE